MAFATELPFNSLNLEDHCVWQSTDQSLELTLPPTYNQPAWALRPQFQNAGRVYMVHYSLPELSGNSHRQTWSAINQTDTVMDVMRAAKKYYEGILVGAEPVKYSVSLVQRIQWDKKDPQRFGHHFFVPPTDWQPV